MRLLHDPAYKLPRARCLVLPRFAVVRFSFATEPRHHVFWDAAFSTWVRI